MADVAKKVQDYKDSLKQKAEHLIIKGFPEKIAMLNEQLYELLEHQDLNIPVPPPVQPSYEPNEKTQRVDSSEPSSNTPEEGTKVYASPNGTVPCNKPVSDLIHLVKPHIRELVKDSNLLKMWISLMISKFEDGNDIEDSIQEDNLDLIKFVESEAVAFHNQISQYFISRAKIVSNVAKYPHIDDYMSAVRELDEKEYLSLLHVMSKIRNHYCILHENGVNSVVHKL